MRRDDDTSNKDDKTSRDGKTSHKHKDDKTSSIEMKWW